MTKRKSRAEIPARPAKSRSGPSLTKERRAELGYAPQTSFWFLRTELEEIDALSERLGVSRKEAIVRAVREALES